MKINKELGFMVLVLFSCCVSVIAANRTSSRSKRAVSVKWVPENSTLLGAVESGDAQAVLKFLALANNKSGAEDVDREKNALGQTALMIAAKNGNVEIVKILLAHGASLWLRDNNHKTAIALAQSGSANDEKKDQVVIILTKAAEPEIYKEMDSVDSQAQNNGQLSTIEPDTDNNNDVLQEVLDAIAAPEDI